MAVPFPFKSPVTVVESVISGVDVEVATVPASPLADTTETSVTDQAPEITIFPGPRSDVELIVFILVADTRVSCFASKAVCVAVDIGKSESAQSEAAPDAEVSLRSKRSSLAGVMLVVPLAKITSVIGKKVY